MTKYRIIKAKLAEEPHYWILETKRVKFMWIPIGKVTKSIGKYEFDNGGAIKQMPFFNLEEAKIRLEELKKLA